MNEAGERNGRWHLQKGVIITIIFACLGMASGLFLQTIYVTRYIDKLDARIAALETFKMEYLVAYNKKQDEQDGRLADLEKMKSAVAVLDRGQQDIVKRMDIQTVRMDQIIELIKSK